MHTIILPYHFDREVVEHQRVLRHVASMGCDGIDFRFLLVASHERCISDELHGAAAAIAPTQSFHCPTLAVGYPEGASGMFWDAMQWVDQNRSDGFALWMESDMCPIVPDWLHRLDADWRLCQGSLIMGCLVPAVHAVRRKKSFYRRAKYLRVPQHINGGACYRHDFISHMPAECRGGAFDVEIARYLNPRGGYADTPAIRLATTFEVTSGQLSPETAVVHGFLQNRDEFLGACINSKDANRMGSVELPSRPTRVSRESARHLHLRLARQNMAQRPRLVSVYLPPEERVRSGRQNAA